MKLSKRMEEILFLLSRFGDGLTRNHIVYAFERGRWSEITRDSPLFGHCKRDAHDISYVLLDKIRVSYDRTLAHLKKLGLIEGGFPLELTPLSLYQGTLWQGHLYKITSEGKKVAEEIEEKFLRTISRYDTLLLGVSDVTHFTISKDF